LQQGLRKSLHTLNHEESVEVVHDLAFTGHISADDLHQIEDELRHSAQAAPQDEYDEPEIQAPPDPEGSSRTVWIFTSYAVWALAVGGFMVYLIADSIGK
jgi:hypothetical protein